MDPDDWRMMGQERYLAGRILHRRAYRRWREDWDHDHCEFCARKFSELNDPEHLREGWTTEDGYHWVCDRCYADFRERFEWPTAPSLPSDPEVG
jgi:hypothetical protein